MSFNKIQKIPSSEDMKKMFPIDENIKNIKYKNDIEIKNILNGSSLKKLVIVGPCSVDSKEAIMDYLEMLAKINEETKEKLFIIPRVYTSKPRTTGEGYKGLIHQIGINAKPSMLSGLITVRELYIDIIKTFGFPIADEILYTFAYPYINDLLSYGAIGARSVENQGHRLLASGMDCSVGIKNSTSGDISIMLNAIKTAQIEHNFISDGYEVDTTGNPYAHGILRGGVDIYGEYIPNYCYNSLLKVSDKYAKLDVLNKSIIVDTNHSNSGKLFYKQPFIIEDVLKSMNKNIGIKTLIKGFMIESYIKEGADITGATYGKSITDPCIDIKTTRELLLNIANNL